MSNKMKMNVYWINDGGKLVQQQVLNPEYDPEGEEEELDEETKAQQEALVDRACHYMSKLLDKYKDLRGVVEAIRSKQWQIESYLAKEVETNAPIKATVAWLRIDEKRLLLIHRLFKLFKDTPRVEEWEFMNGIYDIMKCDVEIPKIEGYISPL